MTGLTVTTTEAAAILGVGEAGVRMMVLRGELEPLCRGTRPLRFWEHHVAEVEHQRRPAEERDKMVTRLETVIDGLTDMKERLEKAALSPRVQRVEPKPEVYDL